MNNYNTNLQQYLNEIHLRYVNSYVKDLCTYYNEDRYYHIDHELRQDEKKLLNRFGTLEPE